MFRFEHPEYLWGFLLIPLLIVLFVFMLRARQQALNNFGNNTLLAQLVPTMSKYKHTFKFILLMIAIILLLISWANPQWGTKREKVKRKSVDVFIALDISYSMLAEDVAPNRIERARKFSEKLIRGLKGDRVGTIIFAGNAYLQMPLTTDYSAAQLFVKSANPDMAPSQGTAISDAIDLAELSFEQNNKQHKALVIITDGETHDEATIARAEEARNNGLLIFTVGVGSQEGGLIPIFINGRSDYKRDKTGNPVQTKLNVQMLQELAEAGGGTYFNLTDDDKILDALRTSIDKIEKREFEQRMFNEFESYFQYFLFFAILFIIAEFLISYRKNRWIGDKDIF